MEVWHKDRLGDVGQGQGLYTADRLPGLVEHESLVHFLYIFAYNVIP